MLAGVAGAYHSPDGAGVLQRAACLGDWRAVVEPLDRLDGEIEGQLVAARWYLHPDQTVEPDVLRPVAGS